jgi:hypothetical protein
MTGSNSSWNSPDSAPAGARVARALLSAPELDALEALVRQHLRVVRRIEGLTEQAAQYDLTPAELPELEVEAQRLRVQIKGTLETWLERLE